MLFPYTTLQVRDYSDAIEHYINPSKRNTLLDPCAVVRAWRGERVSHKPVESGCPVRR